MYFYKFMACLAREPSTFASAHGVCVLPAARPQIEQQQQQQHFKNIAHAAYVCISRGNSRGGGGEEGSWLCLGSVSQWSRKCKLHLIYFNSHIYGLAWHADENGIAKCRRWHKTATPLAVAVACMFAAGEDVVEATWRLRFAKVQPGRQRIRNK